MQGMLDETDPLRLEQIEEFEKSGCFNFTKLESLADEIWRAEEGCTFF